MQDSGVEIPAGNSIMAATSRRTKAHPVQMLKCPRCDSLNTKFCYYNNYNLSQPRHFCKNCRRYWTKGGTLRNVPVGGGCRKNKRSAKQLRKPCSTSAGPSATAPPGSCSASGFVSQSAGTQPAVATPSTNFGGASEGPLEFQFKQDQLLLLSSFIDANSYSVSEAGHFPPSELAMSSAAANWNAADSRKGLDPSEMQWKQASTPGDEVQLPAPLNMEEAEAASRVALGKAPALGLWDSEGGNGIFPYNIDYNGEPLFEMQIGDLGCWGGGNW